MRVRINPYGASESVNLLKDALVSAGFSANKLRSDLSRSVFRGRTDDKIINWGNSNPMPAALVGSAEVLNTPTAVERSSRKVSAFQAMQNADVNTVEFTQNQDVAQRWFDEGEQVFARTLTRAHSGAGIILCSRETPQNLGNVEINNDRVVVAPLYTKAITGQHREFRIHVFKGKVIFVQLKRRRNGWNEIEGYSNVVRNHGNGWIYASAPDTTQPNQSAYDNALKAVEALGLDFGAVDVMTRGNEAWVLEVNTAPGLSGATTMERYVGALTEWMNGQEITDKRPQGNQNEASPSVASQPQTEVRETVATTSTSQATASGDNSANSAAGVVEINRTLGRQDHDKYFVVSIANQRLIAQYDHNRMAYQICGFDMPIPHGDVTVEAIVNIG